MGTEVCPFSYPVGTRDYFSWEQSGWSVKLTTNLYLVLKLPSTYTLPRLSGMMLNEAHGLQLFVFN
jgi:hypothetical protein